MKSAFPAQHSNWPLDRPPCSGLTWSGKPARAEKQPLCRQICPANGCLHCCPFFQHMPSAPEPVAHSMPASSARRCFPDPTLPRAAPPSGVLSTGCCVVLGLCGVFRPTRAVKTDMNWARNCPMLMRHDPRIRYGQCGHRRAGMVGLNRAAVTGRTGGQAMRLRRVRERRPLGPSAIRSRAECEILSDGTVRTRALCA